MTLLNLSQLSLHRGDRHLFEGLDINCKAGMGIAIVGDNGCGKSSLLAALAGLLPLDVGAVTLDIQGTTLKGVKALGDFCHLLSHHNAMKDALTVAENLNFWRSYAGAGQTSLDEALSAVSLTHTKDMPFGFLSTGQRRRIAIARLMVSHRPIWLLDEPTSGLDAHSVTLFETVMANHLAGGGLILAATHLPLGDKTHWQSLNLMDYRP